MITDTDVARIADAVADRIANVPRPVAASVEQVQAMLGTRSRSATYRMINQLGLRSVSSKYRIKDVDNALARRTRA